MPLLFGIAASIQKSLTYASTIRCVPSLVALAQHQTEYLPVLVGIASTHIRRDFHAYHLVQKASSNTTNLLYTTRQPQLLPMDTLPPVSRFTKKLFTCGIPSTMSTIRGKMGGAKLAPPATIWWYSFHLSPGGFDSKKGIGHLKSPRHRHR